MKRNRPSAGGKKVKNETIFTKNVKWRLFADLSFGARMFLALLVFIFVVFLVFFNRYLSDLFTSAGAIVSPKLLVDQISPYISKAQIVSKTDESQVIHLSIGLKLQNESDLNSLIADIYTPNSGRYKQYLTPDEFKVMFGPSDDQVGRVVGFLKAHGFIVASVSSNNTLVSAEGKISDAEALFSVKINNYKDGNSSFFANSNPPVIPGEISTLVQSVSGLDNSVTMHHHSLLGKPIAVSAASNGVGGYTPDDILNAYDFKPLVTTGFAGSGQSVALFELDGFNQSDINSYTSYFNLGIPNISTVLVDGFNGAAGQGAIEDELDIELVAGLASKSAQIVYEGPNSITGLNDTYNKIVTDNKVQVLSTSWGNCEPVFSTTELTTQNNIFKQAAAQGITVYAAGGDRGAYDCGDTNLNVDIPAGTQYVAGVGGTSLTLSGGLYNNETVWSNPTPFPAPKGSGGGGGLSTFFQKLSTQNGPGVQNQYSNGKREVPDVSANADPAIGFDVYCTVTNAGCPSTGWITVGGTSAGSPIWGSATTDMNQYLISKGASRVGFINPALYSLSNQTQQNTPFHDITSGNNLFYPATANYDLASGLGSPDVYNLALDLKKFLLQTQQYQPNHLNNELNGALDVYLYGSDNALWESAQISATSWGSWVSLSSMSSPTPRRTTAVAQNGEQVLFMNSSDGSLWTKTETAANANQWGTWNSLGKAGTTGFINFPLTGTNADGRVEVFETGSNHVLYHNYQRSPNGSWSGWSSLGTPPNLILQSVSMATNSDGRLEIFISASDGNLWHIFQKAPNSSWASWSSLGNPGSLLGSMVVGRNQNGRLEVFANGSNGILYHIYQIPGTPTGWSGWSQLSTQSGFSFNKFTNSNQGPIVGDDANGHLDLFEVGTDGNLWHNYQKAPNSGWAGWSNFGKPSGVNLTSITIHNNSVGDLVLVITGNDGNMWYNQQTAPNAGWSGWQKVSPPAGVNFSTIQ